jgi:hypothetical protein
MRLAPRGAHLDDPRYSLSFTVLGVAVCQEGTAQCSVSMGGGGAGAVLGWRAFVRIAWRPEQAWDGLLQVWASSGGSQTRLQDRIRCV